MRYFDLLLCWRVIMELYLREGHVVLPNLSFIKLSILNKPVKVKANHERMNIWMAVVDEWIFMFYRLWNQNNNQY